MKEWWQCNWMFKGGLLAVLIVISLAFVQFVRFDIAPFYPANGDQYYYLKQAHGYYDRAKKAGYWRMIYEHFTHRAKHIGHQPNVNAHMAFITSFLFALLGSDRLGALSFHLIGWLTLLITIAWVCKKLTRSWSISCVSVGILLWTSFAFGKIGGIADFRMEFSAACWMGIAILLWFLFLHQPKPRYAWLATGATAWLIFFRIITLTYWAPVLTCLGLTTLIAWKRPQRFALRHALTPLLMLGVFSLILVLWDFDFLRSYYLNSQLNHVEIVARRADKTFQDFFTAFLKYPRDFFKDQVGFGCLIILVLLALVVLKFQRTQEETNTNFNKLPIRTSGIALLFAMVLVPLIILTANPHRASQVIGILTIPAVMGAIFATTRYLSRKQWNKAQPATLVFLWISSVVWIAGLTQSTPFTGKHRRDVVELNTVYNIVTKDLLKLPSGKEKKLTEPATVAVLDFDDPLRGECIEIYGREHFGYSRPISTVVAKGILPRSREELLQEANQAMAAIVPVDPRILDQRNFLAAQSVRKHFSELHAVIRARMAKRMDFVFNDIKYELYLQKNIGF